MVAGPSSWFANGRKAKRLDGRVDVDLQASPVTNTIPIRRLRLKVGAKATVDAAWVKFPSLDIEPLRQSYERKGRNLYEYRSGRFRAEIKTDHFGIVKRYGGYWTAV